jgi:hypothetical protein
MHLLQQLLHSSPSFVTADAYWRLEQQQLTSFSLVHQSTL